MNKPQLVEQTSKRIKLVQLAGVLIFGLGALLGWSTADEYGLAEGFLGTLTLVICGAGLVTLIFGSVLAWWHHG